MDLEKALPPQQQGKPSIIKWYCEQAMDARGKESECIWVCFKRGPRWIAKDVQLSARPLGVYELRKLCGWWKRHSLFSAIGVREVKVRFVNVNVASTEVEVVIKDFDHASVEADLDRSIDQTLNNKGHPFDLNCEVDIMGTRYPAGNQSRTTESSYRKIRRLDDLERLKEESKWLPAMLEYYWQNGIGARGVEFLESTEFIKKYSDLRYDTYEDAANPYGKSINAFQILEGWRIQYLLILVLASMVLSICVVAITTAISTIGDGLTAGSYALGLATVTLAVLTFLSAIL